MVDVMVQHTPSMSSRSAHVLQGHEDRALHHQTVANDWKAPPESPPVLERSAAQASVVEHQVRHALEDELAGWPMVPAFPRHSNFHLRCYCRMPGRCSNVLSPQGEPYGAIEQEFS